MHARPRPGRELAAPVVFRPPRATGAAVGGALAGIAIVGMLVAFAIAYRSEPEFKTFLAWLAAAGFAAAAVLLVTWTACLVSMSYTVGGGALVISWGLRKVAVPLDSVENVVPGRTLDPVRVRGLTWPGCHVGQAEVPRMGFTIVYATLAAPEDLVFVVTTDESYALSVVNHAAFAEQLQGKKGLGPVPHAVQRSSASGLAAIPFWRDRTAVALALTSAVLVVVLTGFVFTRYSGLPSVVELGFPGFGGVVRVGEKAELLGIAYAGLAVFVLNAIAGAVVHVRERAAGLWLLASGGGLQVVLILAAVLAFGRA